MAIGGRIHSPAPGAVRVGLRKLDASGPIAPQISALRRAVRLEKPVQGTIADPARPGSQTLISRWNLVGCHGISSVKKGPRPSPNGSALHHLVTAVSVKKALPALLELPASRNLLPVMLPAHTRAKMRSGDRLSHCADDTVKE